MKKFKNSEDVLEFAQKSNLPTELQEQILSSVSLVQTVLEDIPSAQACVILLDSEQQREELLRECSLNNTLPEINESTRIDNTVWARQVYILDDSGEGIIIFYPLPHH